MIDYAVKIVVESWEVLGQMSPYLIFGFLVAGLLSVVIAPSWIERHLGGKGIMPVLKAALFGVPLPLCSCGVIPVAASLRQQGASRAATTSFLLSTPQTGVDSIAVTYALLGPLFAVFRPIISFLTGLLGGLLVLVTGANGEAGKQSHENLLHNQCDDGCCKPPKKQTKPIRRIFEYGLIDLPKDISSAMIFGIIVAGAMSALVPPGLLKPYIGGGIISIIILMAAGVPVYVCATASVPIAVGFIHMGASPGAALAFLIAGPATNAATITTTWKILGRKSALLFMFSVAFSAVVSGLLLDWLAPQFDGFTSAMMKHEHAEGISMANHIWAVILTILLVNSSFIYPKWKKRKELEKMNENNGSQRYELIVKGMTCSHCSGSVERGLGNLPGVESVTVDLRSGQVKVKGNNLDKKQMEGVVVGLGYSVE